MRQLVIEWYVYETQWIWAAEERFKDQGDDSYPSAAAATTTTANNTKLITVIISAFCNKIGAGTQKISTSPKLR